jgi:hypothetical protein
VHAAVIYDDDHDYASTHTDPGPLRGRLGREQNYCF